MGSLIYKQFTRPGRLKERKRQKRFLLQLFFSLGLLSILATRLVVSPYPDANHIFCMRRSQDMLSSRDILRLCSIRQTSIHEKSFFQPYKKPADSPGVFPAFFPADFH